MLNTPQCSDREVHCAPVKLEGKGALINDGPISKCVSIAPRRNILSP